MVFCVYELYPSPIFLLLDFFLMRYKHSLYVREICFCLFLLFAISFNFLLVFFAPYLGGMVFVCGRVYLGWCWGGKCVEKRLGRCSVGAEGSVGRMRCPIADSL